MGLLDKIKGNGEEEQDGLLGKIKTRKLKEPEPSKPIQALTGLAERGIAEQERIDRSADELVDVSLGEPPSQRELQKVLSFREREQEAREKREREELAKPTTFAEFLAKPFTQVSRGVERALDTDTGVTSAIEGAIGGAARQTPLVGRLAVPQQDIEKLRAEQKFKTEVDLPFLGKTEITPVEAGQVAGALGFTAAQYGEINKILDGLGTTSKLGQLIGTSKLAKFGATQATDLLADTIIQTPAEVIDAIEQDKSINQFGKDFLKNRGIDILVNLAVGGAFEGVNALKSLKNSGKIEIIDLIDDSVRKLPEVQQKAVLEQIEGVAKAPSEQGLIDKIRTSKRLFGQDVEPVKLEQPITPRPTAEIPTEVPVTQPFRGDVSPGGTPRVPDVPTPVTARTTTSPFVERIIESDKTAKKLQKELKELDELATTTDALRTQTAKELVDNDLDKALRIAKEGTQFGSRVESEVGRLAVDALNQQGRNAEAIELISKMSEKFRSAGQDVQSAKLWAKTTPEGMQKWAVDTLEKADVKIDEKLIAEIGNDMKNIQQATPEELAKFVSDRLGKNVGDSTLNSIQNSFSYDQLKAVNTALTMQKVLDKMPVLKARKLSTLQAMSHLLNFKTFNRNILGNTASIAGEMMSKVPASMADRAIGAFTGNRSIVADMPKWKQNFKEGWNQGKRSFFEIRAGVGRGKLGKYEALFGKTFKSKPGQALEKLMSLSLQTPDEFFKGWMAADSVYNQVRARLGKQVKNWSFDEVMTKATAEEIDNAAKEAAFATFQNDSFLADVMSSGKKGLNSISTKAGEVVPGLKNMFTEEFGLGDMVIKYTRVPGNIITRGFEYSPLGYIKASEGLFNLMKNPDVPVSLQREIAQQIGRATTGGGLMMLGAKLYDEGIITGVEDSKDYDVGAFSRAEGLGNYKVNLSALKRMIGGGNTDPQTGDELVTYNWLKPMTTPIAVGARLAAEQGGVREKTGATLEATWEEAMDLPTMYIVKQMFFEGMKEDSNVYDIASLPLKEALPGFVPSIVRQAAQTIDPTIRETRFGATVPGLRELTPVLGEQVTGKIQANIPGLSQQLLPKLDPLGREQERIGGILPTMFDPATKTQVTLTEFGNELRQIEQLTGRTDIFPDRKAPTRTTVNRESIQLTPEEQVRWQEVEGQTVNKLYNEFLQTVDAINAGNAEQIADVLTRIKRQAGEQAKADFVARRGE